MKNNNLILVAIVAMFSITALLIFNRSNDVNVYCNNPQQTEPDVCVPGSVPDYDSLVNAMLYYRIDDSCNFQTLRYQYCNNLFYTVLGRFNSTLLPNGRFMLNKLETKFLMENSNDLKITKITLEDRSNVDNLVFLLHLGKKTNDDEVDSVYDKPIELNRNARISFGIVDSTNTFFGCPDVVDSTGARSKTTGGYECNGKATATIPTGS